MSGFGLGLGARCLGLGLEPEGWPCVKTMVLQISNVAIYVCISCFSLYLVLQIAVCGAIYCFRDTQYFHVAHSRIKFFCLTFAFLVLVLMHVVMVLTLVLDLMVLVWFLELVLDKLM